ncbi:hypothetical protein CASFOL_021879 [Castilleja foliolosa]|uniref:F-box domain-containing protein n=1 Tax=Castilleja foliolosa TaxID=1961234 RepID=A0ABD3D1M1_9LAMI
MDRLSQLPQPILHSILSLLPQKYAIRTCVLSKSWRYLWHGRFNVEFRDNWFARKKEFWPFLDKTLQSDFSKMDPYGYREYGVMLNNLRTLRLHYVNITDEVFEKIILGCPLIENLDLLDCYGLKSIKLHKHHIIKNFRCFMDRQTVIEIENPHTLESFYIENWCPDRSFPLTNLHFPHLKSLDLYRVHLPAETFENFSSFFPCLSELILKSCDGLKEFRLLSSSIKRLTIESGLRNRIKAAFIDTPNILYFEFSCDGNSSLPSIKFTTTSNEWKSHISLWYKLESYEKDDTSWLLKLDKLLMALSQSHITLKLYANNYKKLHINDSLGGFYKPVVVEHLKLRGDFSSSSDPTKLNYFFRICRPRYIHMDQYANEVIEFICNLIPDEIGCYFWLQDLEEVSIEVRDIKTEEWNCVQRTSLPPLPSKQKIRFRLTWREQ